MLSMNVINKIDPFWIWILTCLDTGILQIDQCLAKLAKTGEIDEWRLFSKPFKNQSELGLKSEKFIENTPWEFEF